jgi:hypothetical protein
VFLPTSDSVATSGRERLGVGSLSGQGGGVDLGEVGVDRSGVIEGRSGVTEGGAGEGDGVMF